MDIRKRKHVLIMSLLTCIVSAAGAQPMPTGGEAKIGVRNPSLLRLINSEPPAAEKADSNGSPPHENYLRSSRFAGPEAFITMRSDLFFGYEKYRLTRFDRMLEGAQMGAKVGLLMSAVGTTAGLWDEKDSWYLVGALSALGMLLRGSTADEEPQWRIRLHWEPERPAGGVRAYE